MAAQPSEYLRTKVMTASPEELQLMLYDGAIRFASQAREQMVQKEIEKAYHLLLKAQRIIMEMNAGLQHEVNPDLCGRLASLYNFIHRKLVEANLTRETEAIDDALQILTYERDTWQLLLEKVKAELAAEEAADSADENAPAAPSASATPEAAQPPAPPPAGSRPTPPRPPSPYPGIAPAGGSLNIRG